MRHLTLLGVTLATLVLVACGGEEPAVPAPSAPTSNTASSAGATATSASYATEARVLLTDLGAAQRALADALAATAPLSDAWKQAVASRVSALAVIDARALRLTPPSSEQAGNTQLLLATRRSREAAETVAAAVSEGNISMLDRANSLLSDAAFQTAAAVTLLPR